MVTQELPVEAGVSKGPTNLVSTAIPVAAGYSGQRAFATTGNGTIFYGSAGAAPTELQMAPGGGGTPIQ